MSPLSLLSSLLFLFPLCSSFPFRSRRFFNSIFSTQPKFLNKLFLFKLFPLFLFFSLLLFAFLSSSILKRPLFSLSLSSSSLSLLPLSLFFLLFLLTLVRPVLQQKEKNLVRKVVFPSASQPLRDRLLSERASFVSLSLFLHQRLVSSFEMLLELPASHSISQRFVSERKREERVREKRKNKERGKRKGEKEKGKKKKKNRISKK